MPIYLLTILDHLCFISENRLYQKLIKRSHLSPSTNFYGLSFLWTPDFPSYNLFMRIWLYKLSMDREHPLLLFMEINSIKNWILLLEFAVFCKDCECDLAISFLGWRNSQFSYQIIFHLLPTFWKLNRIGL